MVVFTRKQTPKKSSQTRKIKSNDYVIAIPSYKRAQTLQEKTLKTLQEYNIEPSKIYIFVANSEEEDIYRKTLPPKSYNKIIVAVKGVKEVRNFITNYFPIGQKIVGIDDDVKGFLEYDATAKRKEKRLVNLKKIIAQGFSECQKKNCRHWGIYPSANGFFMRPTITHDLRFIVGTFYGIINPGLKDLKLPISEKDDYYRSLRMYELDGCVIRLNFVAPKTAYYKEPGGMQTNPKRKNEQFEAVEYLQKLYPDWISISKTRKSGFPEIRIRDSKKKDSDSDSDSDSKSET